MAAKRHERTRARREALQVLYTSEITEESPAAIAEGPTRLAEDGPLPEYALALVRGVEAHRCAIDGHLSATSENWSLVRMPIVDRSILRLATYEMMYVEDVPTSVAINEAVELAKDFGGADDSPRFVNGVLGRIARRLEEGAPSPALFATDESVSALAGEPSEGGSTHGA
ncbi:transcription antitermination factor NusB [Rubneribacter badeniensis]|uniref:Transcription antitermination protein NusB n=1 Tax=Rubneribacter badeniensis TaxID=2070688 RepID=A0A2K2U6R2_9ACTN|nr:transcription antitermination factor NusB [Rubneribacter badeniensis]PNV66025.1 transcription antitermination factor NusB [Rubneribacter badeniensis]